MAEVSRAVSGVVKWAIAAVMVQPMGIRPMTMEYGVMMCG